MEDLFKKSVNTLLSFTSSKNNFNIDENLWLCTNKVYSYLWKKYLWKKVSARRNKICCVGEPMIELSGLNEKIGLPFTNVAGDTFKYGHVPQKNFRQLC